jgi:hypothetical protein
MFSVQRYRLSCRGFLILFGFWSLGPAAHAVSVFTLVFSDQIGGQTFLNKNHGYSWDFYFTDTPVYGMVRGSFEVKKGPQTVAGITASLYRLDTNALVGSASFAASSGSSSGFSPVDLDVINSGNHPSGYTFAANTYYRLTLTSLADTGNATWYIKDPSDSLQAVSSYSSSTLVFSSAAQVFDAATTSPTAAPSSITYTPPPTVTYVTVPELGRTLPMVVLGAAAALAAGRRRRKD